MANIRPIRNMVLIRRDRASKETAGGILLPDEALAAERPWSGTVVAVGPGQYDKKGRWIATQVKPGEAVVFTKWTGHRYLGIDSDPQDMLLVSEHDVLAWRD